MNDRNIVLTGFMATGKSTVGALLAKKLNRPFVDLDTVLEYRTGLSISTIFTKHGEAFFRILEKSLCHEMTLRDHLVVATGGGTLIDEDNRRITLQNAFVVCLVASPESIAERLQHAIHRPLAKQWQARLQARQAIYQSLPNHIDTTHLSPQEIVEEVIQKWQNDSR